MSSHEDDHHHQPEYLKYLDVIPIHGNSMQLVSRNEEDNRKSYLNDSERYNLDHNDNNKSNLNSERRDEENGKNNI